MAAFSTLSSRPGSSKNPVDVLANFQGHRFACRIESDPDAIVVSAMIVQFLGGKGIFLRTILLPAAHRMTSVRRSPVEVCGQVQANPTLQTVVCFYRLRNLQAFIMPCRGANKISGAFCPGKIVLG